MGYEQWRVGVEFDGEAHHSSGQDTQHDESRRAEIERYGWRIVVARKGDVLPDHGRLTAEVAARLIESGCELDLSTMELLARRISW
jgi:very-short-patch-repair endonuclease